MTSGTRLNVGTGGGTGNGLRVDLTITSGVITAVVIRRTRIWLQT